MTIRDCLRETEKILKESGSGRWAFEAEYIVRDLLSKDRAWIFAHAEENVDDAIAAKAFDAASRRNAGEPLQYILKKADFMGYSLYVDNRVLIPRLDTELMAMEALKYASFYEAMGRSLFTLDLCTGSGALALVMASRSSSLTASDISKDALEVAAINLKKYGVDAELVCSDLFDALGGRRFDLIVSNPPYIPAEVVDSLHPEVKDHEPRLALDGGADGMDLIRRIIDGLEEHLAPEGLCLMEIGNGQGDSVQRMAMEKGFKTRLFKDFSGERRFISIGRDERSVSGVYPLDQRDVPERGFWADSPFTQNIS